MTTVVIRDSRQPRILIFLDLRREDTRRSMANLVPMRKLILLLVMGLFVSTSAWALDCHDLWRNGVPDPAHRHESLPCTEQTKPGVDRHMQLYVSDQLLSDSRVAALSDGVLDAFVKMRFTLLTLGYIPNIKAILYPIAPQGSTDGGTLHAKAFVNFSRGGESCPILIYPGALSLDVKELQQLITHEAAHCFQMKVYPAQTRLAVGEDEYGSWYFEGIAQLISDIVFPLPDLEFNRMFPRYDPTKILSAQNGYANVAYFFSFYKANVFSSDAIRAFSKQMPKGPSGSFEEALTQIPKASESWHHFSENLAAGTISDTRQRRGTYFLLLPASVKDVQKRAEQTIDYTVPPYIVQRHMLSFPQKGKYKVSVESSESTSPVLGSLKHLGVEEEWKKLPAEIETPCDEAEVYDLVISSIDPDLNPKPVSVVITYEEQLICGCEDVGTLQDACLYGQWDLVNDSVRGFFERGFQNTPNAFMVAKGVNRLSFSSNGTHTYAFLPWEMFFETKVTGTAKTHATGTGTMTSHFAIPQNGRLCVRPKGGDLKLKATVTIVGTLNKTFEVPFQDSIYSSSKNILMSYSCRGNELIIEELIGVGADHSNVRYDFHYRKLP